ncbi:MULTISPECIES: hypothetical protein [unclassified Kitasatospora]|uniref:hypothetical protein n=1 Tax=unclassified Kitasatospora TaxID=2633591 RepID=UPI00070B3351|nr:MULTISPECIES: hypothetical protein [unclassified Kitasatospora]KQV19800.1 hypothetical protein ASC99_22655 [Kitasatospora sp. Root107]KRB61301.1 hypothetical protein ASE03_09445 [Kitasatospora sp. Root187]
MELERDGELAPAAKAGLGAVVGAGLLGLALYASASGDWAAALGGGLVVSASSMMVGGGAGFLFGIPRLLTSGAAAQPADLSATSTASYAPNTNLEQVSDWLTKILLGAGLTQIGTLPRRLAQLGDALAPVVGGGSGASAFAASLAVYFTVLGFLSGWLLTRLRLARALSTADRQTLADSVGQTVRRARELDFSPAEVRRLFEAETEGLRVQALALFQGRPDHENLPLVIGAIRSDLSAFELLQALLAAREAVLQLPLTPEEKRSLRFAVEDKLRNFRTAPKDSRRRVVGEEILKKLPTAVPNPTPAKP